MKFAVVGNPISHSLSPVMHQAAYDALGMTHSYEAILVESGRVGVALDRLRDEGYQGVNVTVPHKEEALNWCACDTLSTRARAVNTINLVRREGINTDGPGFVDALRQSGVASGRVLLLGAGGSSRALAFALTDAGYELAVWNRTPERSRALASAAGAEWLESPQVVGFDVIVNATAASLAGEPLPLVFPAHSQDHQPLSIDLYYSQERTQFLNDMAGRGGETIDGRALLVAQGALAFEYWLGVPAPRSAMEQALGL